MKIAETGNNQDMPRRSASGSTFSKNPINITGYHLTILGLILLSVLLGVTLPFVSTTIGLMLIAVIPAIIAAILILRNPFVGVYLFFFYSFLRPYDFISALRPLKLTLVIEVLALVSWILMLILHRKKILWSTFSWLYTGFLAVIGLTVITAMNNYQAYQAFQAMLVYLVIFVIATNVVDSVERLNKIIWLILFIHAYFALKGIYTFVTGQHLAAGQATSGIVGLGFIADENDFALAMNCMIPFAYFGMLYLKGKARFISGVLAAIFVLAVISSFSRGGLLGLAFVIVYGIVLSNRKALASVVVVLLIGVMAVFAPSHYWQEAQTIQNIDEGTAGKRIRYWKAAVEMFLDHPVLGVGARNGGYHLPNYITGVRNPNTEWGRAFHGTLPQVLAELGLFGISLYLAMLYVCVKMLFRIKNRRVGEGGDERPAYLATSMIGSVIAYITTATFLSTVYYPYLWTLFTLAVILAYIVSGKETSTLDTQRDPALRKAALENPPGTGGE